MSRLFDLYGVVKKKGDVIFKEGEEASNLYMIQKGRVQISKESSSVDEELNVIGETEFFGEMALINSEPRSATAVAIEDCELIEMDKNSFESAIRENPSFASSVVRMLTRRLWDTNESITDLYENDRKIRVMNSLLYTMVKEGKVDKTKTWNLVDYDSFIQKCTYDTSLPEHVILSTLNQLSHAGKIAVKKSTGGSKLVGIKL